MRPMAKVLIVDDSPDQAASLARILQATGHDVVTAPNGREALVEVISNSPDVVLLDLLMPEIDGPSFLDVVRSYLRLQTLPVVVITGLSESAMIRPHTGAQSKPRVDERHGHVRRDSKGGCGSAGQRAGIEAATNGRRLSNPTRSFGSARSGKCPHARQYPRCGRDQ